MIFHTPTYTRSLNATAGRSVANRMLALAALAAAALMFAAFAGVSPGLADTTAGTGPTGATGPAGPPGEPACLSRRVVTIHWRLSRPEQTGRYTVIVNGEKYETLPASARKATIRFTGTEGPEAITVQIRTRTLAGETLTNVRHYHTCVPRMAGGSPNLYLGS